MGGDPKNVYKDRKIFKKNDPMHDTIKGKAATWLLNTFGKKSNSKPKGTLYIKKANMKGPR